MTDTFKLLLCSINGLRARGAAGNGAPRGFARGGFARGALAAGAAIVALQTGFGQPAHAQDAAAAKADTPGVTNAENPAASAEAIANGDAGVYLPDFSFAGYRNGEAAIDPAYGKIFVVDKFGAKPDDEIDDTLAIQAAIEAASAYDGPATVRFEAGKYMVTGILKLERSNLVLQGRGRGEGGTTLYFPRPLAMMDDTSSLNELREYLKKYNKRQREKNANLDVLFSEYSWSGGFIWVARPDARPAPYLEEKDPPIEKLADITAGERGAQSFTVANADSLSVGDVVQIQWFNRDGEDGALIDTLYGDPKIEVGSHHWEFPDRPLVRQTTKITKIDGNTVHVATTLMHGIGEGTPAQVSKWEHLTEIGIEDLHIEFPNAPYFGHHVERGYNAIYLTSAYDSWIRNVRITNADSGILTYDSANFTVKDIRTDGDRKAHYTVHMGNVHNALVEGLRVYNPAQHSLTFNTQSTRSVYLDAEVFTTPVLDQHAGSNHQNLFDQVTLHINPDKREGAWRYALYDGSGAPYWQPGHGAFNTSWNIKVVVEGGPAADEKVILEGLDEGPNGRIVGVNGNREYELIYKPKPFVALMNEEPTLTPSLYRHQLRSRLAGKQQAASEPASASGE